MRFKERFDELQLAYEARKEGKYYNSTPLETLPRLNNFIGGIPKGTTIAITADANVGKTPFAKNIALSLYLAKKKNPNIEYTLMYFLLEEKEAKFIDRCITHFHKQKYGIQLEYPKLLSNSNHILTQSEWSNIGGLEYTVDNFLQNIILVDDLYDPNSIYERCLQELALHGKLETSYRKGMNVIDEYVPDLPNHHFIIMVDHLNDLSNEGSGLRGTHEAIGKWCKEYSVQQLAKKANATIFQVIQQEISKTQYTSKDGKVIVNKLKPSKDGLGDNKQVYRSFDIMLGLFAPSFHDVKVLNGWDISILGHNYRELGIYKNRDGKPRGHIDLVLKGNTFEFLEIPEFIPENEKAIAEIYKQYHY